MDVVDNISEEARLYALRRPTEAPARVGVLQPLVVWVKAGAKDGCLANQMRGLKRLQLHRVMVQVQLTYTGIGASQHLLRLQHR